ncbi:MAG: HEPN domain-containing protein [Candidatus Bathyarchaeota archaeon]|nr:HEPN domain-containing protein [Candidatus Bathyarchaeota archaeon]
MSQYLDEAIFIALKQFIRKACWILETNIQKSEKPDIRIKKKVEFSETGLSVSEVFNPTYTGLIFKYEDEIQEQEEINALVEARLNSELFPRPNLVRDDGKPLVDDDYVYSIKWAGVQFLFKYIAENRDVKFNETLFDSMYQDYEYFSVTSKIIFNVVCPLYNFRADVDVIQLNDLEIRKITETEFEKIYFDDTFGSRPDLGMGSDDRFVICTEYESDKHREDGIDIYDNILSVITALRLFNQGNLQYGTVRNLPLSWTSMYSPIIGGRRLPQRRGGRYDLIKEEIDPFLTFFTKFNSSTEKTYLEIAISRFNFIYDRTRNEDKIIDIMVGFESLFVGDKERPSDRGSYVGTACSMLLGKSQSERQKIKKLLQNAFKIRNKIVHGSKYKKEELNKILPNLEGLLRDVIKQLI